MVHGGCNLSAVIPRNFCQKKFYNNVKWLIRHDDKRREKANNRANVYFKESYTQSGCLHFDLQFLFPIFSIDYLYIRGFDKFYMDGA